MGYTPLICNDCDTVSCCATSCGLNIKTNKMSSKVRKIHVGETEWTYAISNKEVRIYEPGTKQIKVRLAMADLPELENDTATGIGPARVKKYIENNIERLKGWK